jgi:hypothetical protein
MDKHAQYSNGQVSYSSSGAYRTSGRNHFVETGEYNSNMGCATIMTGLMIVAMIGMLIYFFAQMM